MACGGGPGGRRPSDYIKQVHGGDNDEYEPSEHGKVSMRSMQQQQQRSSNRPDDALSRHARTGGVFHRAPDMVEKVRALNAVIAAEKAKTRQHLQFDDGHRRELPLVIPPPMQMPRLPLELLNPPAFSDMGLRLMYDESCAFGKWVMLEDEGWLFWARVYTLLFVQARDEDWIMLVSLPELFHFHFGEMFDYGKLKNVASPTSLIRALAQFIESWFDPINQIRIRLNTSRKQIRCVGGLSLGKGELAALYEREKAALITGARLKYHFYGFNVYEQENGEELEEWDLHFDIPTFEQSASGAMKAYEEDLDRINKNRRELYLALLLHFPHEGVEHRELEMLLDGRCWKKDYFSDDMWRSKEFNARVIAGSTWIDDIIEIKEKGPRIRTYYARMDTPHLFISPELLEKTHLETKYRAGQGMPEKEIPPADPRTSNTNERINAGYDIRPPVQRGLTAVDEGPVDGESVANLSFESNVAVVGRRTQAAKQSTQVVTACSGMASIGLAEAYDDIRIRFQIVQFQNHAANSMMQNKGMGRGFVPCSRPGFGQGNLVVGKKLGPRPG